MVTGCVKRICIPMLIIMTWFACFVFIILIIQEASTSVKSCGEITKVYQTLVI